MKIFVLEDDPERIRWMRERFIDHDVTVVDSCAQADQFAGGYDLVLLDHDLGGRQFETHDDDGAHFAKLIATRIGTAYVIVHSYNVEGVRRIFHALPSTWAVAAPFRGPLFLNLIDQFVPPHHSDRSIT